MKAKFLGSYSNILQCPKISKPEYAFWGRSNVGKSSLINSLLGQNKIAKVSGTPGKTQLINLFDIDNQWIIADLPGYGYAKVSKQKRNDFEEMTINYLQQRENLVNIFLLIDIRLPPQKNDLDKINWLGINEIPFEIIYTKIDKLSFSQMKAKKNTYYNELKKTWDRCPDMLFTSSISKKGIDSLFNKINTINSISK